MLLTAMMLLVLGPRLCTLRLCLLDRFPPPHNPKAHGLHHEGRMMLTWLLSWSAHPLEELLLQAQGARCCCVFQLLSELKDGVADELSEERER